MVFSNGGRSHSLGIGTLLFVYVRVITIAVMFWGSCEGGLRAGMSTLSSYLGLDSLPSTSPAFDKTLLCSCGVEVKGQRERARVSRLNLDCM